MENEIKKEANTRATSNITVTSMPSFTMNNGNQCYPNGIEYFHPQSGMVAGTWAANGGSSIEQAICDFYENVFGVYPSQRKTYLYYLYGAKLSGANEYHAGVDMYKSGGGTIKSAHYGTVVYCDKTGYGAVGIYNEATNKTFYYLHMNVASNIKNGVTVYFGDTLGTQGSVGASSAHLHFEVHNGRRTSGPEAPPSLNGTLDAISPYPYM